MTHTPTHFVSADSHPNRIYLTTDGECVNNPRHAARFTQADALTTAGVQNRAGHGKGSTWQPLPIPPHLREP